MKCCKCGNVLQLNIEKNLKYICRKYRYDKRQKRTVQCGLNRSALEMSPFGRLRDMDIYTLCNVIGVLLKDDYILSEREVTEKCKVPKKVAKRAIAFCQKVFRFWKAQQSSRKIGGIGHTVEIGLMGTSLFGGLDLTTEECFLERINISYHKRRKYFTAEEGFQINKIAEMKVKRGSHLQSHYNMPFLFFSPLYNIFAEREKNTYHLNEIWRDFAEKGGLGYWRHVNKFLFKRKIRTNRTSTFFTSLYQMHNNILSNASDTEDNITYSDTYCLCNQVSFGEMVKCDNDLCPIQWFHFTCVQLIRKPRGIAPNVDVQGMNIFMRKMKRRK